MMGFRTLQGYRSSNAPYILDQLSSMPNVAYSLRKLSSAYNSFAISVRRSSDNATTNIGFSSSGDLDTTSLLAFVGSGSGYITVWYDQSGHGVNVIQTTTGMQPRIVLNGVLDTLNSKASAFFLGSNSNSVGATASLATTSGWTASAVSRPSAYSSIQSVIDQDNYTSGTRVAQYARFNDATGETIAFNTAAAPFTASINNSPTILTNICSPTSLISYGNGAAGTTTAVSGTIQSASAPFSLGRFTGDATATFLTGNISEAMVFGAPLIDADRVTLIHNQGLYYGVTVV